MSGRSASGKPKRRPVSAARRPPAAWVQPHDGDPAYACRECGRGAAWVWSTRLDSGRVRRVWYCDAHLPGDAE